MQHSCQQVEAQAIQKKGQQASRTHKKLRIIAGAFAGKPFLPCDIQSCMGVSTVPRQPVSSIR